MVKVTAEQVRQAVQSKRITEVVLRECSICDWPLKYTFDGEEVYFDPSCGCTGSGPEPRTWESVADQINIQTKLEWHNHFRVLFGLEEVVE